MGNGARRSDRRRRWHLVAAAVVGAMVLRAELAAAASGEMCGVIAALDAATLRIACASGVRSVALLACGRDGGAAGDGGEAYGDEARWWVETWLVGRQVARAARSSTSTTPTSARAGAAGAGRLRGQRSPLRDGCRAAEARPGARRAASGAGIG